MKLLEMPKTFKVLFRWNAILLIAHVLIEAHSKNINWMQVGRRSPFSATFILVEGVSCMLLGFSLLERYYPDMPKMLKSREARYFAVLLTTQICVWFLF